VSQKINKRLISPAESINAITVGATHDDASIYSQTENMYDVFPKGGISPFSRIGPGFRNAIKPDILMQGGRMLYTEDLRDKRIFKGVDYRREPGHLVAAPLGNNLRGNGQRYTRGTSNAAALTTRFAGQIYEVIESIRTQDIDAVSEDFEAVLLKALLVHSVNPSYLKDLIVSALDNQDDKGVDKKLSPFIGCGVADPERVMGCTAKRVTLLGYGSLNHDEACDFKMPIPVSLNAKKIERKLTVTLAWISPINASSAKYRIAKLWFDKPKGDFDEKDTIGKQEHENQHVIKKGTVQHAVFKTDKAEPFRSDAYINIKVNCTASHQEKLKKPIRFGLCVTLEVKEKINVQAELFEKEINIYEEIKAKIKTPIPIS